MFRKLTLVLLILSGFMLSGIAGECFADVSAELEQAKSNIISLVEASSYGEAHVQTQTLITDFYGHPDLPEALFEIAEKYRWSDRYEKANNTYQLITQNYPDSSHEVNAALGISKTKVLSLITEQDYSGAAEGLDEMVTNFPNHPNLPEELYWIARKYGWSERHEEEKVTYQWILQNYPNSPFADKAQLGFSRATVQSFITSQEYDKAWGALDELIANFSGHPDLHDTLYWIAGRYEWSGRFEDAKSVHQQIIQNYPDSPSAYKSSLGLSRADVLSFMMSQDYDSADEALDEMITDFYGHPDLPETLLSIGKRCYEKGISEEKGGLVVQSRVHLEKAAEIWDRLISEYPYSSLTPEACCWAGDCYIELGKHQDSICCFQKVVNDYPDYEYTWHAQYTVGRCYEILKDTGAVERSVADAQMSAAYEQLLEKYPDCPATGEVSYRLSHRVKVEQEEEK